MNSEITVDDDIPTGLIEYLTEEDDPEFWRCAFAVIRKDVEYHIPSSKEGHEIFFELGACSHWLRPHQTRWTVAGGFAWPTGYDGGPYSRLGLPEFDWRIKLFWNFATGEWNPTDQFFSKRKLVFRAAFPTRTFRHEKAAVHTVWSPGRPDEPGSKRVHFYGFKKSDGWACVADSLISQT